MTRMLFAIFCSAVLVQLASCELHNASVCDGPGVTADPRNSSQFFICAEKHEQSFLAATVPCPRGYVFSPDDKTCVGGPAPHRISRATQQCLTSGAYCEACDRMVVCTAVQNHVEAIANLSCSEIDPEMSCSQASCSTKAPDPPCDASAASSGFVCLQQGYFPDPGDCKRYHVCGPGLKYFTGQCEAQFDPVNVKCDTSDVTAECKPVARDCKGPNLSPVSIARFPTFYSLCIPQKTSSRKNPIVNVLSVMKCPEMQVFDDTKLVCVQSCTGRKGRFPDPDTCRGFIECTDAPGQGTKKSCPDDFAYDAAKRMCLPDFMAQSCSTTTTTTTTTTVSTAVSSQATTAPQKNNGFQCQSKGNFPIPGDCYSYMSCSPEYSSYGVSYRVHRRQCPFFTYFSSGGFCQWGFC